MSLPKTLSIQWGGQTLEFVFTEKTNRSGIVKHCYECEANGWQYDLTMMERDFEESEDEDDFDAWFFEAGRRGEDEEGREIWIGEVEDMNPQRTPQEAADRQRAIMLEFLGLDQ